MDYYGTYLYGYRTTHAVGIHQGSLYRDDNVSEKKEETQQV
jgi:hypothetical protein